MRKKRVKKIKLKKKVASKATKPSFLAGPIQKTKIRIIGIGGGGSSIVSEIASKMISFGGKKVSFVAANTDLQALKRSTKKTKRFQFGQNLTNGLGCGMNPSLGRIAAKNEKEKIAKLFEGIDFSILVATLGGGTGSGSTPVFAETSRAAKNVTFGIFTLPFKFEGKKKMRIANRALEKLKPNLNALTVIPNEKIFQIVDKEISFQKALSSINKILTENLEGLIEMVYKPGIINIDFADLKAILEGKERIIYLATAEAEGPNRAEEAVKKVFKSPLSRYVIQGQEASFLVDRILFNIVGPQDLGMAEVEQISKTISGFNKKAKIIFGLQSSRHPSYKDKIKITLLAVGREKKIPTPLPSRRRKRRKAPVLLEATKPLLRKPKKPRKPRKPRKLKLKIKPKAKPVKAKRKIRIKRKRKKPTVPKKPPKLKKKIKELKPKKKVPPFSSGEKIEVKVRRNALQIKKAVKETEKKLLRQEKIWETPAFLRKRHPPISLQ